MADTVNQLVSDIRVEGGFDVDAATALRWLNRRWLRLVGDARAYRKTVSVGTTTSGTAFYAFSPVEAYSFEIDGVPYGRARRPDVYAAGQGRLVWEASAGGLILEDADSSGARGITIVPTPTSTGDAITSFAAVKPNLLTADGTGDTLLLNVLEDEFSDELVAGCIATGLERVDKRPDLAAPYEQQFEAGIARLAERTTSRFRGQGPAQIRVSGVNA